jgi:hypothetical protein
LNGIDSILLSAPAQPHKPIRLSHLVIVDKGDPFRAQRPRCFDRRVSGERDTKLPLVYVFDWIGRTFFYLGNNIEAARTIVVLDDYQSDRPTFWGHLRDQRVEAGAKHFQSTARANTNRNRSPLHPNNALAVVAISVEIGANGSSGR